MVAKQGVWRTGVGAHRWPERRQPPYENTGTVPARRALWRAWWIDEARSTLRFEGSAQAIHK
jgi:hypothetical protein